MNTGIVCVACLETIPFFSASKSTTFPVTSAVRRHSLSVPFVSSSRNLVMSPTEPLTPNPLQHPPLFDYHRLDQQLLGTLAYDALVWSTLHGLLVADKSVQVNLNVFSSFNSLHCVRYQSHPKLASNVLCNGRRFEFFDLNLNTDQSM